MRNVYGWLLLTPAAILLIGFTHYPAVATFFDSFFSTGTVVRPSRFVGLANYAALADDPIFWQVLKNNLFFAVATIPTSIAIAMIMAIWVNDRLPARALVRMSYFTPTILPMVAVANLWLFFYTPQIGLIDMANLPVAGAEQAKKLLDEKQPSNALMKRWAESEGKA